MNIIVTEKPTNQDKEQVFQELLKYNLQHLEDKTPKELAVFIEDNGERIGAIIGSTHGNWLEIDYLWINEKYRNNHLGSKLMEQAEAIAIQRECKYAFVNTFHFQAPKFYLKLGYKEEFVLNEYPVTGKRFYYTKKL